MRDPARPWCNDRCMSWDQMPVDDELWTAGASDWGPATDWADAPSSSTHADTDSDATTR